VVAMARTGSGKTAAFLVPMLQRLRARSTTGALSHSVSPRRGLTQVDCQSGTLQTESVDEGARAKSTRTLSTIWVCLFLLTRVLQQLVSVCLSGFPRRFPTKFPSRAQFCGYGCGVDVAWWVCTYAYDNRTGVRGLVLSPSRELAMQTFKFAKELNKYLTLRMAVVVGGDTLEAQFDQLATNPDILIATPGRLMHHLQVRTVPSTG
jgi:ATP-dependent helicase YprA (DUF1998 family)